MCVCVGCLLSVGSCLCVCALEAAKKKMIIHNQCDRLFDCLNCSDFMEQVLIIHYLLFLI